MSVRAATSTVLAAVTVGAAAGMASGAVVATAACSTVGASAGMIADEGTSGKAATCAVAGGAATAARRVGPYGYDEYRCVNGHCCCTLGVAPTLGVTPTLGVAPTFAGAWIPSKIKSTADNAQRAASRES